MLRGISNIKKNILTHYLEHTIKKLKKKITIISKNEYKKYLNKKKKYHYTKEEKQKITK